MLKKLFKNKVIVILSFVIFSFILYLLIQYLKNSEIEQYKLKTYKDKVLNTQVYINTLIKEKQNTTITIGIGLSRDTKIRDALKGTNVDSNLLKNFSKRLRKNTDFKNAWFQLIRKDGVSIQRSWTDYKSDKIVNARVDLQTVLKKKKILNTISVGKFDMSFKAIIPVFDNDNITFLGVIEVITHFNSIAKKLEKKKIDAIVLADKKYKKQLIYPFTKLFINDYYVVNLDVKKYLVHYFRQYGVEKSLQKLKKDQFYIDNDLQSVVSYFEVIDEKINSKVGYILLVYNINQIDRSKISYIKYIYNIYLLFSIIVLALIFYFFTTIEIKNIEGKSYSLKIFITICIVYSVLAFSIYKLIEIKYKDDVANYKQIAIHQVMLEYNAIVQRNKDISEFIFNEIINKEDVKNAFKNRDKDKLYNLLEDKYKYLKRKYNIKQLHFYLSDSTSFLRVDKPLIDRDNLTKIRPSVDYVNKNLKPFFGFEKGRIYNGYRYLFPLFDNQKNHIGSVEISFDIQSFVDIYRNLFEINWINFLISKKNVKEKIFQKQQSNDLQSSIKDFYLDKEIVEKYKYNTRKLIQQKITKKQFDKIATGLKKRKPFVLHFKQMDQLTIIIPIINQLTNEVVSLAIVSKNDKFIKNRLREFHQLISIVLIVLGFVMFFIYKEYLSKIKAKIESKNNQIILDSQNSFIIITDGFATTNVNNKFLKFFGYENLDDFKKDHNCICDFFLEGKREKYLQKQMGDLNWFEYMQQNKDETFQVKIKDNKNQIHIFYIEFDIKNHINDNNFIVTFIDITHLKNIEKQLLHSEKMASLGSMIGNIAHQWRQPLSVISTAASGVHAKQEYGLLQEGDIEKNMDYIVQNAKYLSETIDIFRDFIQDNNNKENGVVNINELMNSVLKVMDGSLKKNYIEVVFNSDKTLFTTLVKGELIQVLTNLIDNAKDALQERKIVKPQITITTLKNQNNILIMIEDNGGGIESNIIDKIFEPYFTTKHKSIGTGLGLYICHKIVTDIFGGNITVQNTSQGAQFTIELPLEK